MPLLAASSFAEAAGRGVASALLFALTAGTAALADNAPEKAQRRAQEDILPKVVAACGVPLAVSYDGESLRKHNKDIGYDQTGGSKECDEPLRYLWYACRTTDGRAAIKAARVSKIACKGTSRSIGTLALSAGTITVERAFEEPEPFLRSRGQFCSSLKVALPQMPADPYTDEAWNALPQQANPVTSTTTYCLVNGDKVAFDENGYDPFCRRKQDAKVKCLKDGAVVIDLDILQGRKTGVVTTFEPKGSRRVAYRDDKREGEERITENGKVKSLTWYEKGERIWTKELFPSGKVSAYSRKVADGVAEISVHEDGKVFRLRCSPTLKDDQDLRRWCGFDGAVTTPIYDGTGKIARVQTWKDGVLQKEAAGTSDYGSLSDVAFKDGKKHGEERVYARATNDAPDAKGKLAAIVRWDRGAKDGRETVYADDGVKVTKEIIWKAGETKRVTELYLNGNPKLEEAYDTPTKKQVKAFWDTGKVSREGLFLACDDRDRGWRGRAWCEDGVHRSYFESGAPESEVTFRMGKREGTSKTWWATGKAASVEDYVADHCTKAKRWDQDGKVVADDEFEADGSRKLKK